MPGRFLVEILKSWYAKEAATESDTRGPTGPLNYRVARGGCWPCMASGARCASRSGFNPGVAGNNLVGFRCVMGL